MLLWNVVHETQKAIPLELVQAGLIHITTNIIKNARTLNMTYCT